MPRIHALLVPIQTALLVAIISATAVGTAHADLAPLSVGLCVAVVTFVGIVVLLMLRARHHQRWWIALAHGIEGLREGEYNQRLSLPTGRHELARIVDHYNTISDQLGEQSHRVRQRELLVEAIVEHTGTAVFVVNELDRVMFASRSARQLFFGGRKIVGNTLESLLDTAPEALRMAVVKGSDSLVAMDDANENLFVQSRQFELNTQIHRLVMMQPMSMTLRREELAVWKQVVRVISHELNSAMTPVSSLLHSAQILHTRDDAAGNNKQRLADVLQSVALAVTRLRRYVDGYASFARLPAPTRQMLSVNEFVHNLGALARFRVDGQLPTTQAAFDSAQVQQALLNLLRNASEAAPDGAPPQLHVEMTGTQLRFEVRDDGPGMDAKTMRSAVLPLFSTKTEGTGLGLAVAREVAEAHDGHLALSNRPGGGLSVCLTLGLDPT